MTGKQLLLGTAQWAWTVSREEAFRLLDDWLKAGQRAIDSATNYPIDKNPEHFRAAEGILQEYIQAHGLHNLQVTMKIGALDNLRSPEANLAPSFVRMITGEYRRQLGDNLSCIMLHWDNRNDSAAVAETLHALADACREEGLRPGLSGIRHPEVYAPIVEQMQTAFDIQLKHNLLHSDLPRYAPLQRQAHRWFAYGINAGGLKLEGNYPADSTLKARGGDPAAAENLLAQIRQALPQWNTAFVRPPITAFYQIGLLFAALHPHIDGIVLGCSSAAQLRQTLNFWRDLETFDYIDVFAQLSKIAQNPKGDNH
ncbi:MAG: aldo/keto reductase [Saprospiraceae bacterium]|nr:aldo/keto reductase [Saprospiraceae bacterium]MDW8230961.1 aldo/keto reductase [Saprospiraceae bacterium]